MEGKTEGPVSFTTDRVNELYLATTYLVQLHKIASHEEALNAIKEELGCKVRIDTFTPVFDKLVSVGVLVPIEGDFDVLEGYRFSSEAIDAATGTEELVRALLGDPVGNKILVAVGRAVSAKPSAGGEDTYDEEDGEFAEPATPSGKQSAHKPRGPNRKTRQGNGKGVKVKKVTFSKKGDAWYDLLLLAYYCVDARGSATVSEVHEDITGRLGARVNIKTLSDALDALRLKELLAALDNSSGDRSFKVKRFSYNCSPTTNDVYELLSELRSDSTGAMIVETFSNGGGGKGPRRPHPEDPHLYEVLLHIKTWFLAGNIWGGNDDLQQSYYDSPKYKTLHLTREQRMAGVQLQPDEHGNFEMIKRFNDHKMEPLMFLRSTDGNIIATHTASIRGFLVNSARYIAAPAPWILAPWHLNHFGLKEIIFDGDERYVNIFKVPVVRKKQGNEKDGATPNYHEQLRGGTPLTWRFTAPTVNYITPARMKEWLSVVLAFPFRSMSPARGGQFGGVALKSLRHRPLFGGDWIEE